MSDLPRYPLYTLISCILVALTACAGPSAPTAPVPEPPSEATAMQAQILEQIPILQWMACLSNATYYLKPDPLNNQQYIYDAETDPYQQTCRSWLQVPTATLVGFPITLYNDWGKSYESRYVIWTDSVHRRQVIAVRGTDDKPDQEADLHFRPVPDDILKVSAHQGFIRYARAVYASLTGDHQKMLRPDYDIYFAGHSLGGAAAVLTGLYLYVQEPYRYKIKGVYTFGQPRVFDSWGVTSWPDFSRNVYRAETCYDPVPLVPIGDDVLHFFLVDPLSANSERRQYQHMGREILLMDKGTYWMPGGNEVIRDVISDLEILFRDWQANYPIDHSMSVYIDRIWGLNGANGLPPLAINPAFDFANKCHPYSPAKVARNGATVVR